MCHHYKLDAIVDELFITFKAFMSAAHKQIPLGNFYPINQVPVIRQDEDGKRELLPMEWGLLPAWWKPSGKCKTRKIFQRRCFNARSETVHEKPSYREAFKSRRCLVPVSSFEEKKHYFSFDDQKLFAFAGLWESWQGEDEEILSCSFLTTEPNAEIRSIGHSRMPILLRNETEYSKWLNPDLDCREALEELLLPTNDGLLHITSLGGE